MKNISRWMTEGDDISTQKIDNLLYENYYVREFLDNDNKRIIIAGKGVGKTLLLKKKRSELEKRNNGAVFIPSPSPYLDFAQEQLAMLGKNHIGLLQDSQKSKLFWQFSLILSVLSYHSKNYGLIDLDGLSLPPWINDIMNSNMCRNPCDIFTEIVCNSNISKMLESVQSSFLVTNRIFINTINYSVHIFIDRLDQALKNTPKDYWISIQTGLLEASWDLTRKNRHVKVYCSIRQEAYYNYASEDRNSISGSTVFIQYTVDDLVNMINKLSICYENKDFPTLMGKKKFQNPKTGIYEKVEDYIIRHTMSRPRDFVAIIGKLNKEDKFETKYFRDEVNKVSHQEISKNIFYENSIFLNCLKDLKDREMFLSLIPHNILDRKLLLDVCCKYNNKTDCSEKGCHFTKDCKHPFSELYNLGLLGIIDKDDIQARNQSKQKFKRPQDIKTFNDNLLPENIAYYLIHPCLNDYIKELRPQQDNGGKSFIIPFIMIKPDLAWGNNEKTIYELFILLESKFDRVKRDEIYNYLKPLSIKNRIIELNKIHKNITNELKNTNCKIIQSENVPKLKENESIKSAVKIYDELRIKKT